VKVSVPPELKDNALLAIYHQLVLNEQKVYNHLQKEEPVIIPQYYPQYIILFLGVDYTFEECSYHSQVRIIYRAQERHSIVLVVFLVFLVFHQKSKGKNKR
jgi:hypothetical protein